MLTDFLGTNRNVNNTTKNQYFLKSPIGIIFVENEVTPTLLTEPQHRTCQEKDTFPLKSLSSTSTLLCSLKKLLFKRDYQSMIDTGIFYVKLLLRIYFNNIIIVIVLYLVHQILLRKHVNLLCIP